MIIKGNSNNNKGGGLCNYVLTVGHNEKAEIKEVRGTTSENAAEWFQEIEAAASGTRCKSPFYHVSINPRADEKMTHEQFMQSVELLEEKANLKDHARLVLQHINEEGREHYHVVWSRLYENEKGNLVSRRMSWNYLQHEKTSRELERLFDHERVQGVHVEREGERPPHAFSNHEMKEAKKTGIKPALVREEVTEAWNRTETGADFMAALDEKKYLIARGEKQGALVLVDEKGGIHGLTRRIEGARAADVRERMKDIDREALPSVEQAKQLQAERVNEAAPAPEQTANIEKEKQLPHRSRDYSALNPKPEKEGEAEQEQAATNAALLKSFESARADVFITPEERAAARASENLQTILKQFEERESARKKAEREQKREDFKTSKTERILNGFHNAQKDVLKTPEQWRAEKDGKEFSEKLEKARGDRKEKRAADALERWEERQAEKSKEKSAALPGREGEQIINGGLNAAGKVADSLVSMLDGFFDILAGGSPKPPPAPEPRSTQPIKTEADMMRELFELGRDEQNARRAREREREDEGRGRER